MTNTAVTQQFDWLKELEKVAFSSLTTTFGLDFLLVKDKQGGDVDTVHNVRQGIYATETERQRYENRGKYDGDKYHQHKNYKNYNNKDSKLQRSGQLTDAYTGKTLTDNKDLDHIVSAKEIHDDAGRVLAELDGVELANMDINFASTHRTINRSKGAKSMQEFLDGVPKRITKNKEKLQELETKLANMPDTTPQERHERREQLEEIRKIKEKINVFEEINKPEVKEQILKKDKEARQKIDEKVNQYYKSSKFLLATGKQSVLMGYKMGLRQALGLVLAEVWFELKIALPEILKKCQVHFDFKEFIDSISTTLKNIFDRVQSRFKELLVSFKDGFLGGVLSSISTTIINIFFTTSKLIGKLIRESWQNLVQVAKLIFFNPDNLSSGQLFKEITRIILASISTIIGVAINQHLATIFTFPFGTEIATFISALLTGVLMIGCAYFIDYSAIMQKIWNFLDGLKSRYDIVLEHLQQANAELDEYLLKLAKIEFNLSPQELQSFTDGLAVCADEYQKFKVIKQEIERRNITLPFEMDNDDSVMQWLNGLTPKH